ncbi:hypothetical protein GCM10023195_12140 [Actinoallomurus liliacearum]|uniref:non-specific serine/threonine protein kinase n=1 Tax=Actinoallomurus liliacearum TaxID=1080073 RepID=A0ABP8TBN1_9ACTN
MGGLNGELLAGRYQLVEKIGQGGMGVVWRAFDTGLDREVAVKELRLPEWIGEQEHPRWYARMGREARAAARLKHPGIVTVYDRVVGEDGRPWIVMELIHGTSLADELKRHGRLPVRRVAAIGLRLLEAVSVAHAHGIVHRDIKPANVLFEGDRVVLTDFGIAALEGDATLTHTGSILGTPAYMSPEQVHGRPVPESDLWSLGATLYDAVEGHPPFTGPTNGAIFAAIATQDPVPPAKAGPLAPVLSGLLRKTPAERLTAEEARDLLTPLVNSRSSEQQESAHRRGPSGKTLVESDPLTDRDAHSASVKPKQDGCVTPHVRKIAAEQGVDLNSIKGTGANGRIREQDVITAARKRHGAYATAAAREFATEHGVDLAKVQGTGADGLILVQDAMRGAPVDGDAAAVGVIAVVVIIVLVLLLVFALRALIAK